MKRCGVVSVVFCLMFLGFGVVFAGETYESSFGFKAIFPDQWMVLDRNYAKEHPDAVESAFISVQKDKEITAETKSMLASVREMILKGEIEYYFSESPKFVVAVNRSSGKIPGSDEELKNLCSSFPSELSAHAGRPVKVYECSRKSFNGNNTLVLIADGQTEGNRYVQYQVAVGSNSVIVFTATGATASNFDKMVSLMESFMNSLQVKSK